MNYAAPEMLLPHHLMSYRPGEQAYGVAMCALDGDVAAQCLLADHLLEFGEQPMKSFAPGNKVLIKTVTMYYVGEIEEEDGPAIILKDASWVHWTGQLSRLMSTLDFEDFPDREGRARTEYVGNVGVLKSGMISFFVRDWKLPTTSLA